VIVARQACLVLYATRAVALRIDDAARVHQRFQPKPAPPKDTRAMENSEPVKQSKTAAELEALILADILNVEGCPQKGVKVTVYGIPWSAMLMFGAEAGPVRNKDDLKQFFGFFVERLQRLYDIRFDDA
jgi:hypothetical protein